MPRTRLPGSMEVGPSSCRTSNYPTADFFFPASHEQRFPDFATKPIVSGRRVNLPPRYDVLLIDRLQYMGWNNLINLPSTIYPRLTRLFYLHFALTVDNNNDFIVSSYVKMTPIVFNIRGLAEILEVDLRDYQVYFNTEEQMAQIVGDISEVYSTICSANVTNISLQIVIEDKGRSLIFGALLTKFFRKYDVSCSNEE